MAGDINAPDPGPRPVFEQLSNDQTIAKYGPDLTDAQLREEILTELVNQRRLSIAVDRKAAREKRADDAWMAAYMRRYGTDEG